MPPLKTHTFQIPEHIGDVRLDRFLTGVMPDVSRSFIQKLIEQGKVTVNQRAIQRPAYKLHGGETVQVEIPRPEETHLVPQPIPLDIVYEDEHLLVVNKPPGLVVHPGAGVKDGTLVNAILYHCATLSGVGGKLRPGIVHRLDKNTSGLLVVAKDDKTHVGLQQQLAQKTARREYKALVWGTPNPPKGRIETYVARSRKDRKKFAVSNSGKLAITLYQVDTEFLFLSLVNVQLKTGRSHQIRIHFKHIHHPVFGDPEYGGRQRMVGQLRTLWEKRLAIQLLKQMPRQALHAYRLGFIHPIRQEWMQFEVDLPPDFSQIIHTLKAAIAEKEMQ